MLELQFVDNRIWRMNPKKGRIVSGKVNVNKPKKGSGAGAFKQQQGERLRAGLRLEVEVGCNSCFTKWGNGQSRQRFDTFKFQNSNWLPV